MKIEVKDELCKISITRIEVDDLLLFREYLYAFGAENGSLSNDELGEVLHIKYKGMELDIRPGYIINMFNDNIYIDIPEFPEYDNFINNLIKGA